MWFLFLALSIKLLLLSHRQISINKISKFLLLITLKIKATTVDSHSQVLKDV